jgi:hypothetical protein
MLALRERVGDSGRGSRPDASGRAGPSEQRGMAAAGTGWDARAAQEQGKQMSGRAGPGGTAVVGHRGRGHQCAWAGPGRKGSGPAQEEQCYFRIIIKIKLIFN